MSFLKKLLNRQKTNHVQETTSAIPPSAEDLEKAKKIFFANSCDYSVMRYEGVFDEFQKYHVSKEQESVWRTELIAHRVNQLSVEDPTTFYHLVSLHAFEAIPDLFPLIEKGDSVARLELADVIWLLKNEEGIDLSVKKQAEDIAIQLWNSLTNINDVWIFESRKEPYPKVALKKFRASTPEEYIVNRAKRSLANLQK